MPHSYLKVVGNHRCRCNKAAHAIRVRTTMLSLHLIEKFLRFQVQDKHNASSFSHMSLDGVTSIQLQNYKKAVIISLVWANYYDLMSIL